MAQRDLLWGDRRIRVAASLLRTHLARSDHWFGAINPLLLLMIVAIPYPVRAWCFHFGTLFEPSAAKILLIALALTACTWMGKWFYGMSGRRVMDERFRLAALPVPLPAEAGLFSTGEELEL